MPWKGRSTDSRSVFYLFIYSYTALNSFFAYAQRKLIAPAFSPQALKDMSSIMFLKAEELRDRWDALIAAAVPNQCQDDKEEDKTEIDVWHWASRATFDVVGLAGFDYAFQALKHESEEVYLAYRTMFDSLDKIPSAKQIAEIFFPIIEKLLVSFKISSSNYVLLTQHRPSQPDKNIREINRCLRTIRRAGEKLIANKKAAITAEASSSKDIRGKDILSLLSEYLRKVTHYFLVLT